MIPRPCYLCHAYIWPWQATRQYKFPSEDRRTVHINCYDAAETTTWKLLRIWQDKTTADLEGLMTMAEEDESVNGKTLVHEVSQEVEDFSVAIEQRMARTVEDPADDILEMNVSELLARADAQIGHAKASVERVPDEGPHNAMQRAAGHVRDAGACLMLAFIKAHRVEPPEEE